MLVAFSNEPVKDGVEFLDEVCVNAALGGDTGIFDEMVTHSVNETER